MAFACAVCGREIADGDLFVSVNGGTCIPCYDGNGIMVDLAGYSVPHQLLREYAEAVETVRRGARLASSGYNPLLLLRREQARQAAHRRIFEAVRLPYGDHHGEGTSLQAALSQWLEANTLEPQLPTLGDIPGGGA